MDITLEFIEDPKIAADLKKHTHGATIKSDLSSIFNNIHSNITDKFQQIEFSSLEKSAKTHTINSFDLSLLLRMALSKIPQIPFEYILDVFRWDIFSEEVPMDRANGYFWQLLRKYQGLGAPGRIIREGGGLFDAGAKFHVADNTPFVRLEKRLNS